MKIKLHLEREEYEPIERTAEAIGCDAEDVVFAAVDAFMSRLGNLDGYCGPNCRHTFKDHETMRAYVKNLKDSRKDNLPIWADTAGGAHNYESFPAEHSHKAQASKF